MQCPHCKAEGKNKIVHTIAWSLGNIRIRQCVGCTAMWQTFEPVECPNCGATGNKHSRVLLNARIESVVMRYRQCESCGFGAWKTPGKFKSYEESTGIMRPVESPAYTNQQDAIEAHREQGMVACHG
jgi:transcriptional regulator NrdR family protein